MADIELGISPLIIAEMIDIIREATELDEDATGEDMQEKQTPEDDPESLGTTLPAMLGDLNTDEQAELIALMWLGRGDYTALEWPQALALARQRNADGSAPAYLLDTDMLADLISEGMAMIGQPVEEIAR